MNYKSMAMNLVFQSLKNNGAKKDDIKLDWYEPATKEESGKLYVEIDESVPIDYDDLEEKLNKGGAQIERSAGNYLEILLYEGFGFFYRIWKQRHNGKKKVR